LRGRHSQWRSPMPNYPITFPSDMKEVFAKLSSGYHLCIEDGDVYRNLIQNYDYYRTLFDLLGYELSDGVDGIFYFLPTDKNINEISKQFTAFMAIMYDWLADQGKEPVSSLTEDHFYLNQLPHLTVDQYKKIMGQLDIVELKELLKIVNGLQRHGFLLLIDGSLIKFRKTVIRFVNMFTDVVDCKDKQGDNGESDE